MKRIAILNGYKMILPHYGEYNGMCGYFTSEGFIYAWEDGNEGILKQEIESVKYDDVFQDKSENINEVYSRLSNCEY